MTHNLLCGLFKRMLISLNSEDRVGGTNEEPIFDLTPLGSHHTRGSGTLSVRSVTLPYTFYTVETGVNNTFTYVDSNAVPKLIYITGSNISGSPSATQMITNIQTQLNVNTDGAVWTVAINQITAKITFSSTKLSTFQFGGAQGDNETYKVLGFDTNTSAVFLANTARTFPNMINLSPHQFIFIRCNLPIQTGHDFDSYTQNVGDAIAKVEITGNPFTNIYYEPKTLEVRMVMGLSGQFTFRLTNRKNKVLNLNGIPWSITLDFDKVN
jgi:hypothetical protein